MKLVTIAELRASISGRDSSDSNALYETTIRQVTLVLESILCTKFAKATQVRDVFCIASRERFHQPGYLQLVLKRGLVNISPAPVDPLVIPPLAVEPPITMSLLTDFNSISQAVIAPVENLLIDTDRGVLTLLGGADDYNYAVVTYNAGFDTENIEDSDPVSIAPVYVGIPAWLKTAALAYGYEAFQSMRTWSNDTSRAAYKAVSGSRTPVNPPSMLPPPSQGVMTMLRPYLRNSSVGVYPMN